MTVGEEKNQLRLLLGTKRVELNPRLSLLGYGLDDQADPAIHPFFDSMGSIRTRLGGRIFASDKKYTATGTVNGSVDFKPKAGSPMKIDSVLALVGGTKATAGDLQVSKQTSGSKELAVYGFFSASLSNVMRLPTVGVAATSTGNKTDSTTLPEFWNPDFLRVTLNTMVLNEIFTVRIRAFLHGPEDPDVAVTNVTEADE